MLIFKVLPSADGTKSRIVLLGLQGQTRSSISCIIYGTTEFWFDIPICQQIGSMLCFGLSSLKLITEKRNQHTFMKPFTAFAVIGNLTMTQKKTMKPCAFLYCIKNNFQEISKLTMPILYHSTNIVLLLNSNFTIKLNKESQTYSRCFK